MTAKSTTKKRASRSVATKTPKEKTPNETPTTKTKTKTKTKTTTDTTKEAKSTKKKRTKPRVDETSDVEKTKKDQPRPSSKKNETNDDGGDDPESTPLLRAVGDRLRFLFSDANLRADRRLRAKMRESGDGSISVSDLLRLRTIKSLTERTEDVTEAARKHCSSLVEVVKNNALRRTNDFDPAAPPDLERARARSVVLSGLPATDDGKRYDVTVREIVDLFDPRPALVKLRYDKKGKTSAKDNAFVEFHDEESAKKVLKKHGDGDGDGTTKLRLKDKELTVVAMTTWNEARVEKKRPRDEDVEEDDVRERGRVVSLKGLPDGCDRETILAFVKTLDFRTNDLPKDDDDDGSPSSVYVDYSRGQKDGSVHFPPKTTCDKKLARIVKSLKKGKRTIGDTKHKLADAALLAGEKEKAYWKAFAESKRTRAKRRRS